MVLEKNTSFYMFDCHPCVNPRIKIASSIIHSCMAIYHHTVGDMTITCAHHDACRLNVCAIKMDVVHEKLIAFAHIHTDTVFLMFTISPSVMRNLMAFSQ